MEGDILCRRPFSIKGHCGGRCTRAGKGRGGAADLLGTRDKPGPVRVVLVGWHPPLSQIAADSAPPVMLFSGLQPLRLAGMDLIGLKDPQQGLQLAP